MMLGSGFMKEGLVQNGVYLDFFEEKIVIGVNLRKVMWDRVWFLGQCFVGKVLE